MRERMIVTDVARMLSGVCIAGYSTDLSRPIRPVLPFGGGLAWESVSVYHGKVLAPFTVIDVDLEEPRPDPPHCEDVVLSEPLSIDFVGRVPETRIPIALEKLAFNSVDQAFGALVTERRYLPPGTGDRSLATVKVNRVDFIGIDTKPEDQTMRLRLEFQDGAGQRYRLPVTDLGLRTYCHYLMVERRQLPSRVGARIRQLMNSAERTYVRIGASRPFRPRDGSREVCYLLVTGVHSIPEYRRIPWDILFDGTGPLDGNPLPDDVVTKLASS